MDIDNACGNLWFSVKYKHLITLDAKININILMYIYWLIMLNLIISHNLNFQISNKNCITL